MSGFLNGTPFGNVVGRLLTSRGEPLAVGQFSVSENTIGENLLIAAVTNKIIAVTGLVMIGSADSTWQFLSGSGGSAITGPMSVGAKGGFAIPPSSYILLKTVVGEGLYLTIANAASCTIGGWGTYMLLDEV